MTKELEKNDELPFGDFLFDTFEVATRFHSLVATRCRKHSTVVSGALTCLLVSTSCGLWRNLRHHKKRSFDSSTAHRCEHYPA